MKIIINGAAGYMGAEVLKIIEKGSRGAALAYAADREGTGYMPITSYTGAADVIIDFSHHSATAEVCKYASEHKIPLVLCTTGQTEDELDLIDTASKSIPLFRSGNMSLGIALLIELAKKTAAAMPDADIEIIESHHNRKEDAPSGTALMIAEAIREVRGEVPLKCGRSGHEKRKCGEIGIHAIRAGNIVGIHEVIVCTDNQSITLKHEAYNRALFAEGAVAAAEFLCTVREAGIYNMYDMLKQT